MYGWVWSSALLAEEAPPPGTAAGVALLLVVLLHELEAHGVDDVLGLVEHGGDRTVVATESVRLIRGRRGDEGAVRPVHVGHARCELLAVRGAAPRRLGREVEV